MKHKGIINKFLVLVGLSFVYLSLAATVYAQQQNTDPLACYAPEFVMQNQQAIGLTDEQKKVMKNEILKMMTRFNELQWDMQEAGEAFHNTIKENPVDENRAKTQLDKVLNIEREIKHLQVTLVVRIKNLLTDEQRAMLQALKSRKS